MPVEGKRAAAIGIDGDLEAFLEGCPAYDHLESAVAVFDRAVLRYANEAFAAFDRDVRDRPELRFRRRSLLDCADFAAWLDTALDSGEEQWKRLRVFYSPKIHLDLTLKLRPIVDAQKRHVGSMLTFGEESVAFDRRHLAQLQETRRALAARIEQLDQEKTQASELVKVLLKDAPAAMLLLNGKRQILQANRAAERLFGRGSAQLIGSACDSILDCHGRYGGCPVLDEGRVEGDLCDGLHADGSQVATLRSAALLGSGSQRVIVEIFIDMTEHRAAENRIAHLAHHDSLTGLFNRFSLEDRLEQALATARRQQICIAVLFIDMDRFKHINDTLGHATGDAMLIEVAHRLRTGTRESDIVARFGGDEFVVVLSEVDSAKAAAHVARKMLHSLGQPYRIAERTLYSTPSVGVALFPDDGEDAGTLIRNADSAMYHAKAEGRNNVQAFTHSLNQTAIDRLRHEHELRAALSENRLELHYQPRVDRDGRCQSLEALVRWRHPKEGLIPPGRFIPFAEDCGLIHPIGDWVLQEACRQLREWHNAGLTDVAVAVNLSAHQLRSQELVAAVGQALDGHRLSPAALEFEVTESVAMHNPAESVRRLKALRDLGIAIAIDDFGTGYSSLSYLKQLPIDTLKLDRSFVREIETDPSDVAICSATISLAHNLGLKVIAEGVETAAQRDFLFRQKCDFLQGFYISEPLCAADALDFLRSAGTD